MKKILTFFLLLGMSHIFPIELKPSCENMNFKPIFDFYSNNKLSVISAGRGYTGIAATGNLGSVNLNPASLDIANTMQAYYEYGLKNNYTLHEILFTKRI
ncbi:MAG TPA: hypothetical protein PLD62_05605 [Candidatus Cloacimonadota bacterium]|nr:hypothetical protein [Candidatus Cloacimonadota bacterium]